MYNYRIYSTKEEVFSQKNLFIIDMIVGYVTFGRPPFTKGIVAYVSGIGINETNHSWRITRKEVGLMQGIILRVLY